MADVIEAVSKTGNKKQPSALFAAVIVVGLLLIIVFGIGVFSMDYHVTLLVAVALAIFACRFLGYTFDEVQGFMINNLSRAMPALFIFITIGAVIGSWIQSGTIPAMIYYGVDMINPTFLLPAALILCTITSICVGTSWGTLGTMGIVFMGIGGSLGIPAPITAGCVISGALTGDKMSPISETTNLAPIAAESNIYDHIKAMMHSTLPSWIICLVIYTVMGFQYGSGQVDPTQVELVKQTLASNFNINIFLVLPIILTLTLSLLKFSALVAMYAGVGMAVLLGVVFQDGVGFTEMFGALNYGYSNETGVKVVDSLLNRGGIQGMMWSVSLSIIIIAFGGILEGGGFLNAIVQSISRVIKKPAHMVPITVGTGVFLNMATSDSYSSIILTGSLYRKMYDKVGLARSMLSRCAEEGATLTIGMFPWTASAAFYAGTLGVATAEYWKYTYLALVNPLLSIGLAYMGVFLIYNKNEKSSGR